MVTSKIKIAQAVIVEGRYDRAVLESVIDAVIIPVNGFGIYKDKKKLALIRNYANTVGVILLTDSDNAGRQIRDYLKSCLGEAQIHHLYVPNLLEVEDTDVSVLRRAFMDFKVADEKSENKITREILFDDGFIGGTDSAKKRKELLSLMGLPENLSTTSLLDVINKCNLDYEGFVKKL